MSKFEVHDVFRLPSRKQFVVAGKIVDGRAAAGMTVLVRLDPETLWSIPVVSVQFVDRLTGKDSLVGLLCDEQRAGDAEICREHCPMGTVIELCERVER